MTRAEKIESRWEALCGTAIRCDDPDTGEVQAMKASPYHWCRMSEAIDSPPTAVETAREDALDALKVWRSNIGSSQRLIRFVDALLAAEKEAGDDA